MIFPQNSEIIAYCFLAPYFTVETLMPLDIYLFICDTFWFLSVFFLFLVFQNYSKLYLVFFVCPPPFWTLHGLFILWQDTRVLCLLVSYFLYFPFLFFPIFLRSFVFQHLMFFTSYSFFLHFNTLFIILNVRAPIIFIFNNIPSFWGSFWDLLFSTNLLKLHRGGVFLLERTLLDAPCTLCGMALSMVS